MASLPPRLPEGLRVLIVEDEALLAEELRDRLGRLGGDVVGIADTADAAVAAAERERPDLVLMDVRLKGKRDGIDAAAEISNRLGTPVVFATAHSDRATVERALALGQYGYVLKPYQEDDLIVAIDMAVQRHAVERGLREAQLTLHGIVSGLEEGIVACDARGRVAFINPTAAALTGWRVDEAAGRPLRDVLHLEDEATGTRIDAPELALLPQSARIGSRTVYILRSRAGVVTPVEVAANVLVGAQPAAGTVVSLRSMAERRAAEARTGEFFDRADVAIFRFQYDPPVATDLPMPEQVAALLAGGRLTQANQAFARIYGAQSPAELTQRGLGEFGGQEVNVALTRAFVEARYRINDIEWQEAIGGAPRWFKGTFLGELQAGRLAATWGTQIDITERKQAEQKLAESEARFRSLTELSTDFYWEQDASLRFRERIGMRWEEKEAGSENILGRTRWELPAANMSEEDWARHRADLDARREFRGLEIERVLPSGARRWISTSGRPIFAADGRFLGYRGVGHDITAQKNAEAALRRSEQRYRALVDLASDFYWQTDREHRFVFREGGVLARMGLPPEQDYGKTRWELDFVGLTPADWDAHRALLERREEFRDLLFGRPGRDGRVQWASISGRPLYDEAGGFLGYHGTGRDVTAQVEAESALRESEARFRSLALLSSDWFWEQDAQFRFTALSGVVSDRLRDGVQEHLGKTRWEVPSLGVTESQWREHRAQLEAHQPFYDLRLRRSGKDGQDVWLELSGEPFFDGEGRFQGYRGVGRDVTVAVRAEQEIRQLNESLEQRVRERTAELEVALRELEAFSYSVSHDLRAPLRAIHGFTRLLAEDEVGTLSDKGRQLLGSVERNAQRMSELIDALLVLARVSRTELKRADLDLGELAQSVADELRRAFPAARLVRGRLPLVRGDAPLVRQALVNLLENGLKYSSRAPEPVVELGWSDREGAFFVRDNGVGFDMALAEKLFAPFQRLHSEAEFAGHGIGLAIVERVVKRHGGRIWADSAPGAGATFYFTLPA